MFVALSMYLWKFSPLTDSFFFCLFRKNGKLLFRTFSRTWLWKWNFILLFLFSFSPPLCGVWGERRRFIRTIFFSSMENAWRLQTRRKYMRVYKKEEGWKLIVKILLIFPPVSRVFIALWCFPPPIRLAINAF